MAIIQQDSQPFQPYARLMNILGDQLITDKIVAVIELLKNCYDADSPRAEVRFGNMSNLGFNDLPIEEQAYIEIRDYGCGMDLSTIKDVWLRPATPNKIDKKNNKESAKTKKGRVIQGEKGIGRFAIHKLGEKITLYTKAIDKSEIKLEMDFSEYDPGNANLFNQNTSHKLLEEVKNSWYVNSPAELITYDSGTIIRIYNLREEWRKIDFENLYKNIQRLIPPFDENAKQLGIEFQKDFNVDMYIDNQVFSSSETMTFSDVIERAQFSMIGSISNEGIISFKYKSNTPQRSVESTVNLLDEAALSKENYSLQGNKHFTGEYIEWQKKHKNKSNADNEPEIKKPKCGPFSFTFYAFDLKKPDRTILNDDLKAFIKENFVYVLRDGVRVYPYGEKGIDWLNLDKLRSTYRAGQFISYNDLTGFIYISQNNNPLLSDASNRQGIINTNGAYDDFTSLVTAATEIFNAEIKIDKLKNEIQQEKSLKQTNEKLTYAYDALQKALTQTNDAKTLAVAKKFVDTYQKHLSVIEERMKTVEDLAGLGMAVEKSSHDSLRLLLMMRKNVKDMIPRIHNGTFDKEELAALLSDIDENLSLVYDDMQLIQPLYKIQRKTIENVSVLECIKKVIRYFRYEINNNITTNIDDINSDIVISTNRGVILQIFINLIDNAIYWLNTSKRDDKNLHFQINPSEGTIIVADNGNGIREDIVPLIFNEFVSMKSNGRGLGLYIVRELLFRINAEIFVLENEKDKILSGANFIIKLNKDA